MKNWKMEIKYPLITWAKRQKCLHLSCSQCKGTGIKSDGSSCIHMISCPCPKCSGITC